MREAARMIGPRSAAVWMLAATVALAALPGRWAAAQELRGLYSGNAFLNEGHYDLAAAEYRRFLQSHPQHEKAAEASYGLAVCLYHLDRHAEAVAELEKLRRAQGFPYAAETLMVLGRARMKLGQPDDAAAAFAAILQEHPAHEQAEQAAALRAEALNKAERHRDVTEACRVYVTRFPQGALRERVELIWGLAETALGDDAAAALRFGRMAEAYPQGEYAGRTLLLWAKSLHRSQELDAARAKYEAVVAIGDPDLSPEALYGLAIVLQAEGRHAEAGARIDEFLRSAPEHDLVPAARLLRGRVWFELGDYERALAALSAVAAVPGDHRDAAAYWSAKCLLRQGRAAEAARRFAEALAEFPASPLVAEMAYDRAVALVRAGRPAEALGALERFRADHAEHALAGDALHLTAATLHQERRYDQSLERCLEFAGAHPDHALAPRVAYLIAENQFLLRKYEPAERAYRSFLERYPRDDQTVQARFRLGMSLYHQGRIEESRTLLSEFARGASTEPAYRGALLALGDGAFQLGEWAEAQRLLGEYLEQGPDQPLADDALLKLGLSLARQGDDESAAARFAELLEGFPASPHRIHALFERGQALAALDRPDEAGPVFERVLAEGPDSRFASHAHNHLGALALKRGEYVEAAGHFADAARAGLDGDEAGEALFQSGQALMSAQRFTEASVALRQMLERHPGHAREAPASALLAIAQARLGDAGDALASIARVRERYAAALESSLLASLLYEKAWCLRGLDRGEEAAAAYQAVLDGAPGGLLEERAMLELSELQIEEERYRPAAARLRELRQRLEARDDAPRELGEHCLYQLGVCEYHLGNHRAAAELFEAFLEGHASSTLAPSARLLAGESYFRLDLHRDSLRHLERVAGESEGHQAWGPALLRLGECQAALRQWDRSDEAFRRYLERVEDPPLWYEAQFGVGFALENRGRHDEAIEAYRLVVELHEGPTAARAQFQIGECLFAERRLDEAVAELLKVDFFYGYPEWSAAALCEAGRCFREQGDAVRAREQLRKVIERFPESPWAERAAKELEDLERTGLPGHD